MSIHNEIANLETRMAGLKELIARRESQQDNAPSEGVYKDPSKFLAAHRKELHDLALNLVVLKCSGNGWDPLEVIERMKR